MQDQTCVDDPCRHRLGLVPAVEPNEKRLGPIGRRKKPGKPGWVLNPHRATPARPSPDESSIHAGASYPSPPAMDKLLICRGAICASDYFGRAKACSDRRAIQSGYSLQRPITSLRAFPPQAGPLGSLVTTWPRILIFPFAPPSYDSYFRRQGIRNQAPRARRSAKSNLFCHPGLLASASP